MIRAEFYRIIKSKKSIFLIIAMLLIPFIDLYSNWRNSVLYELQGNWDYYAGVLSNADALHPSKASFLAGSSHGHLAQMLLIWLLPVFLLLIYCDSYVVEKRMGFSGILLSKKSRAGFVLTKLLVSFVFPFTICFASLGINFLFSNVVFSGGLSFKGLEDSAYMFEEPFRMSIENPIITYLIYMLVFCIIAGGIGVFCTSMCFLIPNHALLYPCCIILWMLQIMSPYTSITYAIQPFIEYGFSYIIPALIILGSIIVIALVSGFILKVKKDEY